MPNVIPNTDWFILFENFVFENLDAQEDSLTYSDSTLNLYHFLIQNQLIPEARMKKYVIIQYFEKEFEKERISLDLAFKKLGLILNLEESIVKECYQLDFVQNPICLESIVGN